MKKINWGIIGLGNIASKFAEGFSETDNANIKGVASHNKKNLDTFKKKFGINKKFCFSDYKDLIATPEIDIVYIALPNSLHTLYIKECALMNKNILVEKPAFTNLHDLEIIKKLYLEKKIFFTEGFMYRYFPYFNKIKETINNNTLGQVIGMESTFNIKVYKQKNFFGIKLWKPDYSNRLFNKEMGGGAILDIGCYPLSLSTFVNDIKTENVDTFYCDREVDICSSIQLNFNDKFYSNITCSFKHDFNQFTKINFEYGSLSIDETWLPGRNSKIRLNNQGNEIILNFKNNSNIYSYQIQSISDQLINKNIVPSFPSMTMEEIEFK